ncbi:ubiquitin-like small modifier protein 1 [Halapricum hydrolyticum]|uniref:MoaD/ThiS family protein n=1 Tax=Halapricum hydrolyticum TaxID=2979991 RepID=A0AAE3I987_9EURY|nr:ubiquitin-like small modifier protein 1 [Halapricum hydrolyticum]MCU4717296.1 MoaD/ThiS family protein [Halapricum hydrolyticum]MCU4726223.1 MoaD/ThiS family protein [Halapricum hydrolyticum]
MELTLRFFASFREVVGQKTIVREYDDVSTVGDVLEALTAEYPGLELHGEDGSLREYITVMRNGRDVAHIDGLDTELSGGETLSLFPPVAGG